MRIRVDVNVEQALQAVGRAARQIPYAAKDALNATALQIQEAERAEMNRLFTIRKAGFMSRRVKMFKWARVFGLVAEIGIDTAVQGSRLLLSVFEKGGRKDPAQGSHVAIPITGGKARPVFRRSVPAAYRMDRLGLHSVLSRKGSRAAVRGDRRTFILPTKRGEYALFQREGRNEVGLLYLFRSSVALRKRLSFVKVAVALAEWSFPRFFNRYLAKHLRSAR